MPAVHQEAAIYLACLEAKKDGVDHLATGVGADGRFGGFSHFYKDRTVAGFKENLHKQFVSRSEEHTSELQSRGHLVCRLLLEKKKIKNKSSPSPIHETDKQITSRSFE